MSLGGLSGLAPPPNISDKSAPMIQTMMVDWWCWRKISQERNSWTNLNSYAISFATRLTRKEQATKMAARPQLSIISWNAGGIQPHAAQLKLYTEEMEPDVVCIQETWLRKDTQFELKGYSMEAKSRIDRRGGELPFSLEKPYRINEYTTSHTKSKV